MTTPDHATRSDVHQHKRKFWLRTIWISLTGVLLPPLLGISGTIIGMMQAFGELSKAGEHDAGALADNISTSLYATASGLIISSVAAVVLLVALIRFFTLPKVEFPGDLS